MANTILIKRSSTPNAVPAAGNLVYGELAINYADGNLFYKNSLDTVTVIASNKFVTVSGNVTGNNVVATSNVSAGNISATSNISAGGSVAVTGNVSANVITANIFIGDGSQLTGIDTSQISNGNSSIQSLANANITVNPAGVANVAVFAGTGVYVTGVVDVTGNVSANNLSVTNAANVGTLTSTGNITAGAGSYFIGDGSLLTGIDATLISNGNASVQTLNNANVEIRAGANGNISAVFRDGGANITGNLVTGGIWTDNYYDANGAPIDFQQAAGSNTQIQFNSGNNFGASAAFTFNSASNVLSVGGTANVTGNVNAGNLITTGSANVGSLTATGNVSSANISTGNIVATGSANVASLTATGDVSGANVSASGNVSGNNLSVSNVATVSGSTASTSTTSGALVVTGGAGIGGNINVGGNAGVTGTVSAGAITATGNVSGGNITTTGEVSATTLTVSAATNANTIAANSITVSGNIQSNNTVLANSITSVSGALTIAPASGNINLFTANVGAVVLQDNRITGLATPTAATDAVTKQYVDDAVSTGITTHTPVRVETPTALAPVTYAQGGTVATVTAVISPNTVTVSGSTPTVNDQYWFANTFNGILANTAYFVVGVSGQDATLSRSYGGAPVTNLVSGTSLTQSVRVNSGVGATLTSDNNGALIVDGVTLSTNDRVLVYNQTPAYQNGVYVVTDTGSAGTPWILTRAADSDSYIPDNITGMDSGDYFFVQQGVTGAGESYVLTAPPGPILIGYDSLTYTQFSSSQVYSAGSGLALTGTTFSANVDNITTAIVSGNIVVKDSAQLTTPNIGAATGTSLNVTGSVTAASVDAGSGNITTTGNIAGGNAVVANLAVGNPAPAVAGWNTSAYRAIAVGNTLNSYVARTDSAWAGITTNFIVAPSGSQHISSGPATLYKQENGTHSFWVAPTASAGATPNWVQAITVATSGAVTLAGNITANTFVGSGAGLTSIPAANISGSVTTAVTAGTVTTNAQPNITSVGTLTTVRVSGNANISGALVVTGNVTGGNIITTGSANVGTLAATGNIVGGNIATVGLANIARITITAAGNVTANTVSTSTTTGAFVITGGLGVGGNIYAGALYDNGTRVLTVEATVDGGTY